MTSLRTGNCASAGLALRRIRRLHPEAGRGERRLGLVGLLACGSRYSRTAAAATTDESTARSDCVHGACVCHDFEQLWSRRRVDESAARATMPSIAGADRSERSRQRLWARPQDRAPLRLARRLDRAGRQDRRGQRRADPQARRAARLLDARRGGVRLARGDPQPGAASRALPRDDGADSPPALAAGYSKARRGGRVAVRGVVPTQHAGFVRQGEAARDASRPAPDAVVGRRWEARDRAQATQRSASDLRVRVDRSAVRRWFAITCSALRAMPSTPARSKAVWR